MGRGLPHLAAREESAVTADAPSARIPMGPQGRALRHGLLVRLGTLIAGFSAVYLVLLVFAQLFVVDSLASFVADATSEWLYVTEEECVEILQAQEIDPTFAAIHYWDAWYVAEDTYAIRDLTAYHYIKTLKIPVAIALYIAGIAVILLMVLNRSVRYFNELSYAVTHLLNDKTTRIQLSPDLSIAGTELTRIQERSLADDRAAAAAEQRKNELVAYLAHDVKTPLTSVLGYLQLLEESPEMPAEQRARYAGIALQKTRRLDAMMDEFFEITRYNLKAIPLEREGVDLFILCKQAAEELYPQASERNVEIDVRALGRRDGLVDAGKLARVLANILRNAVAYADAGSRIILSLEGDESATAIRIENQGREISPAHLESIFEKFFREDRARNAEAGGAGLGLAIAKEIVVAHGGAISAESQLGRTVFTVRLPRAWGEAAGAAGASPQIKASAAG